MSKAFRLGLFIVSTASMLAVAAFLIGERQFLFARTYPVKSAFTSVAGLIAGAEVRIGGVQEGIVKSIQLPPQPEGPIIVVMYLEHSTRNIVRSDSVASIGTEGLLGNKFVEISFGSEDASPIAPWDTISGAPAVDVSDLVKKANDAMADVQASAAHLNAISAKIDQGQGTIGALVNDRSVFDRISKAATQANAGAAAFSDDMQALKRNFLFRGYFDKRGYEDSTGLTDNLIPRLPGDSAMKTFHYEVKKVFADAEHAKLKDQKAFDDAGRFLERYPFGLAVIVARSGALGDTAALETLLQARAMVVRGYLVTHFKMDDTRVKTMYVGKEPDAPGDAGAVDILIYSTAIRPPR
jgi:phospholipid/cholesterol/gamma-HCH transport system substrate-binding protein